MNEKSQWLGIVRPSRATFLQDITENEKQTVGRHFEYLQELLAEGTLILAGRTQADQPFGISIFEAIDQKHAERIMAEDPAVIAGVFIPELFPYRIAVSREFVSSESP